jgi:hypothetical protein
MANREQIYMLGARRGTLCHSEEGYADAADPPNASDLSSATRSPHTTRPDDDFGNGTPASHWRQKLTEVANKIIPTRGAWSDGGTRSRSDAFDSSGASASPSAEWPETGDSGNAVPSPSCRAAHHIADLIGERAQPAIEI